MMTNMEIAMELARVNIRPMAPPNSGPRDLELWHTIDSNWQWALDIKVHLYYPSPPWDHVVDSSWTDLSVCTDCWPGGEGGMRYWVLSLGMGTAGWRGVGVGGHDKRWGQGAWVKFAKIVSLRPDMEMVVIPVTTFARVIRRRPWVGSRNNSVPPIGETKALFTPPRWSLLVQSPKSTWERSWGDINGGEELIMVEPLWFTWGRASPPRCWAGKAWTPPLGGIVHVGEDGGGEGNDCGGNHGSGEWEKIPSMPILTIAVCSGAFFGFSTISISCKKV